MAEHFKLKKYKLDYKHESSQLILYIKGNRYYYHVLQKAFPNMWFSRALDSFDHQYDWVTYIETNEGMSENYKLLLDMLKNVVCIDDALSQTFALGYHGKSEFGDAVYKAKPYKKAVTDDNKKNGILLVDWLESFIKRHPSYSRSDYLLAVPCDKGKKFDLPNFLVNELCTRLDIANASVYVEKSRRTERSMKDIKTLDEKMGNIRGVFQVIKDAPLNGKLITIIDDIYESGLTIHELGTTLMQYGAIVQGLAITKTVKDID